VELVGVGPNSTQIRYFRMADQAAAERIRRALADEHVDAKPVYVAGYEASTTMRPGQFELWLAPSPAS